MRGTTIVSKSDFWPIYPRSCRCYHQLIKHLASVCTLKRLKYLSLTSSLIYKRPRGRVVSGPDFRSRGRGFESRWRRDSSRTYTALLWTEPFIFILPSSRHPSVVSKWLRYCWTDRKTLTHPSSILADLQRQVTWLICIYRVLLLCQSQWPSAITLLVKHLCRKVVWNIKSQWPFS